MQREVEGREGMDAMVCVFENICMCKLLNKYINNYVNHHVRVEYKKSLPKQQANAKSFLSANLLHVKTNDIVFDKGTSI